MHRRDDDEREMRLEALGFALLAAILSGGVLLGIILAGLARIGCVP